MFGAHRGRKNITPPQRITHGVRVLSGTITHAIVRVPEPYRMVVAACYKYDVSGHTCKIIRIPFLSNAHYNNQTCTCIKNLAVQILFMYIRRGYVFAK